MAAASQLVWAGFPVAHGDGPRHWSMHYIGMLAFTLPVPVLFRLAYGVALAHRRGFRVGRRALRSKPEEDGWPAL